MDCENLDDLKLRFRKLCIKLHPDHGGNKEDFIEMYNQYEMILKSGKFQFKSKYEQEHEYAFLEYLKPILAKIIHLDNIHVEIIGTWIWVSGDTFNRREYFKECGFMFSGGKKAWFYNGESKKSRTFKKYSIEDLRDKWGYVEIQTNPAEAVA